MIRECIGKCKKELVFKIITSLLICGTSLLIPYFWGKVITYLSDSNFDKAYFLILICFLVSSLYYFWCYINQKSWYTFYSKLFIIISGMFDNKKISELDPGKYANLSFNDTDIVCTFIVNLITRIIYIVEFIIILISFYFINKIIFLISFIVIFSMLFFELFAGKQMLKYNEKKKKYLDKKIIEDLKIQSNIKKNLDFEKNKIMEKSNTKYVKSNYEFNILSQGVVNLVLFIIDFSRYGILFFCINPLKNNLLDIGVLVVIYNYYCKIITNFETLGDTNIEYQNYRVSLKRLYKIID